VRLGKRKVTEMEGSGDEMEKEPEGSNKKVSKYFFLIIVTNRKGTDKIKTSRPEDYATLQEVCMGRRALSSEGAGARLPALQATKSRL
jgi:hypothetical protein